MKNLILNSVIFFGFVFSIQISADLKPLSKVLEEHEGQNEFLTSFSSKRCAAIYLEVGRIMQTDNPGLMKLLVDSASELTLLAALMDSRKDLSNITPSDVASADADVKRILKIVKSISNDHYAKTGVYLEAHMEDLKTCRILYPPDQKIF